MATDMTLQGNMTVQGDLRVTGTLTGQNRTGIRIDRGAIYPLELQDFRVHDAFQTALGTAGSDDLGITAGAFGTGVPYITSGDVKALGAVTRYARTRFQLPIEYDSGEAVAVRFSAGMITTIATPSCTVDVEVYKTARNSLVSGSDLVTTSAQSINSLTFANLTFVLTASALLPGDTLDIRIAIIANDTATVTAVIGALSNVELLLDVKG